MRLEGSADRRSRRAGRLVLAAVGCAVLAWTAKPAAENADAPVALAVDASAQVAAAPARPIEESGAPLGSGRARTDAREMPAPTTTVLAALRRARAAGTIGRSAYRAHRRGLRRARGLARRLSGTPAAEMAASLAMVEDLAARRLLTANRMRAAFLTLRRNAQIWQRGVVPAASERFTFGRDPTVFQYFPGHGLAFHPLASFGRVNARARICLERLVERRSGRERCRPRSLRHALDRLAGLAVRRNGFTAWEYLVPFGGGTPPWISAMAQATAIQALARGAKALHVPRWRSIAEHALGAFEQPAPTGVRVAVPGGIYYAMYPFAPALRILNGSLQSLLGLYDHAALSGSARARQLLRAAEPTAREAVIAHDTGSWSLYSRNGRLSPLEYHRLVITQLAALCERLEHATYCDARRRFARYERMPPALELLWGGRRRVGEAAPIAFSVSQPATIRVLIRRGTRTVLTRALRVSAARHVVAWTPTHAGRYRLTVRAVGRRGGRTTRRATLTVTNPSTRGENRLEPDGRRRDRERGKRPTPSAPAKRAPEPTPPPDVTPTPAPAAAPPPTAGPVPTVTADPTPEAPDPAAVPDPTATLDPSPAPDAVTPDATAIPDAAAAPEPTAAPDSSATPGPGATRGPTPASGERSPPDAVSSSRRG